MAQQAILEVLGTKRLAKQRIIAEVDHSRAKVIAGAPVGVDFAKLVGAKRLAIGVQSIFGYAVLDLGHGTMLLDENSPDALGSLPLQIQGWHNSVSQARDFHDYL